MKKLLPLLFFTLAFWGLPAAVFAANESEPNGTFATANYLPQDTVMNAAASVANDYDYFKSLTGIDGTLKIYYTWSGGTAGSDFYVYAYNKGQSGIGNRFRYNAASGTDSIIIHCRQADSIYLLVQATTTLNYQIHYTIEPTGTNDAEPNNSFAEATYFAPTDTAKGRIGYYGNTQDVYDYYKSVLPDDGTLKIYVDRTNTGASAGGAFYIYAYNRAKGGIGNKFSYNQPVGNASDTITIHCRQADSVYFLIQATSCFSYKLRFEVIPPGPSDIEPNNSFAEATYFAATDTAKGRIGYYGNSQDVYDYYKSVLPDDGTLKIYVDRTNTSASAGGAFYIYAYNRAKGGIGNKFSYNQPVGNASDTITIHCRQADSVYFLIQATSCFTYKLRFEVIPPGPNDTEPNNSFAEATYFAATDTAKGRIGYYGNSQDVYDYYKSVLPDDGTLKIYVDRTNTGASAGGAFYIYAYNRARGGIGNKFNYNQPLGSASDTITIHCRQADSVYFLIQATSCFTYKLRFEVIPPGPNDTEPNNTFAEATYFAVGDTAKGRIGYTANSQDVYDYYKSVLPEDGTLKIYVDRTNTGASAGGAFYIYAYNRARGGIGNKFNYNQPLGSASDTIIINCRQADSVYFLIQATSCFSYQLRYEVIPSGTNDAEPNNTLAQAPLIALTDTLKGRIGHTGTSTDNYDFFRFKNEERSQITAYVDYNNTSNTTTSLYFYFQNKSGGTLLSRPLFNRPPGPGRDTLILNCAPADTLAFRVYATACFNYEVRFKTKSEQPTANIIAARTGPEYGFTAETRVADTLTWDFGNGQKTGFPYPTKTFAPGSYTVTLKATNRGCNLSATDSLKLEVRGIESYNPKRSGIGGDLLMTIYGGGLSPGTQVKLLKGTDVITASSVQGNAKRNMLTVNFDVHLAPAGTYDVEVTIPGEAPIVFAGGMVLTAFKYPYCRAGITGPDRWRINRETPFELNITNRGNVNGSGVMVAFAFPKTVSVSFVPSRSKLPRNGSTTVEVDGERFTLANSETAIYADSSARPIPINTLAGKPFDGYLLVFKMPKVPANGTITMPFKARTTATGTPTFTAWTYHPNYYGSAAPPHWSSITNNLTAEAIDALDRVADKTAPPVKVFVKVTKIGQKHLAHAAAQAGAHFDAWWNGYEVTGEMYGILNSELDEANAFAIKTTLEELATAGIDRSIGKVLDKNLAKNKDLNGLLARHKGWSPKKFDRYLDKLNELAKSNNRSEKFNAAWETAKNLKTLNDKLETLRTLVKDCPELKEQLEDLEKLLDEQLDPKDEVEKPTTSVVSMDPNAIYGPEGVLGARYRKDGDPMHYMIACENVDTAQAAAQVVRIVDTLDPTKFDLSTFEFGNVYIGTKAVRLLSNRDEFFGELSLYPEMPLKARIIAKLNKTTGVVVWEMVGVDTATGLLPYDPDLGLLPPNTAPPAGEATVSYTVRLKEGLPSGTEVRNSALIYFDDNEPIATNVWSNTLDIAPPASALTATLESDTVIKLRFTGTDTESGVIKYRAFVQTDSVDWMRLGIVEGDTMTMIGTPGTTYRFSVSAIDNVGNTESKTPRNEAQVTLPPAKDGPGGPAGSNPFVLYPNPSTGQLFIRAAQDREDATVALTDYTGRVAATYTASFKAGSALPLDLSNFSNGMYLVRISGGGGPTETYKVVLAVPKR